MPSLHSASHHYPGRQAQAGENVPRSARPSLVAAVELGLSDGLGLAACSLEAKNRVQVNGRLILDIDYEFKSRLAGFEEVLHGIANRCSRKAQALPVWGSHCKGKQRPLSRTREE